MTLTVALMVTVLGLCESLASIALSVLGANLRFPEPRLYLAEPSILHRIPRNFDAELGWITPYGTPYGERPRAVDYGRPLVSAFGDSFTHGDEVSDGKTWAEALAASLGGDVYNFGVGGYGMDQTLLRFERDQSRRPTPIVIFAFVSIDLGRCSQRYWKFHSPQSQFPMTKPRLALVDGELQLLPNPVRTAQELEAGVQDVAFVERLSHEDPSFNPYGLPPIHRPHLLLLSQPSVWRAALAGGAPRDTWEDPNAVQLAERILIRFAQIARERGTRPVILHMPSYAEMAEYRERGQIRIASAETRAICERNGLECVLPLFDEPAGPMRERWDYFVRGQGGGHYSARGHRWIADVLAEHLRELAPEVVAGTARAGRPAQG